MGSGPRRSCICFFQNVDDDILKYEMIEESVQIVVFLLYSTDTGKARYYNFKNLNCNVNFSNIPNELSGV